MLVVTHSPQVAARAAHHYRIEKSHGDDGTRTTVRSSATTSAARRSRGCCRARRSPTKRGRRRHGCSTRHDGLCRAAARREPVGKRKLKMDDLKRIADELGLERARTYIASGNLLFASDKSESALKAKLEAALHDAYGQAGRGDGPHREGNGRGRQGQSLRRRAGQPRRWRSSSTSAPPADALDDGEECRRRADGAWAARNLCALPERPGPIEAADPGGRQTAPRAT